jgi:hypothetical protein
MQGKSEMKDTSPNMVILDMCDARSLRQLGSFFRTIEIESPDFS